MNVVLWFCKCNVDLVKIFFCFWEASILLGVAVREKWTFRMWLGYCFPRLSITLSMIYTVLYVEQYIWLMAILYPHIVQEYSISSKIEERDRSKSLHSRNSTKQYGPVYFMIWIAGDSIDSIDSNMSWHDILTNSPIDITGISITCILRY